MASKKISTRRIRIDDQPVHFDDWDGEPIALERKMIDIWKGRPGEAGQCMNAQCIMRLKKLFPFQVLGVSVIKSRVYILDRPDHAIRFVLSEKDSRLIQQHDEKALGEPGTLTLRPPTGHNRKGSDKRGRPTTSPSKDKHYKGKRNKPLSRGEKARVLAAVGSS